jgi:leader peptidase (prepilin peptidase)/N-methyltransferase
MTGPGEPIAWLAVAAFGGAVGWALAALVPRLLASAGGQPDRASAAVGRRVGVVALLGTVALWWWEMIAGGQSPLPAAGLVEPPVVRFAGHVVLFALLAAASWIDLRHRVIPDEITAPGALAGLAWSTVFPAALLPIAVAVPRSFAQPLLETDVLGCAGGLRSTPLPTWLEPRPAWTGLAAALVVVLGWWVCCTAPLRGTTGRQSVGVDLLREPRNLFLVVGLLGTTAAWWNGGLAWRGLLSGLTGLLVAAAMIWLTRAGASRALGREAMGFGDVTLMAMMGAWLGWQACVLVCFLAVFIGLVHGVLQLVLRRESELPFGPSLCLAAALVVVFWRPLWRRVGVFFAEPLDMAAVIAAVIGLTAVSLLVWRRLRPI